MTPRTTQRSPVERTQVRSKVGGAGRPAARARKTVRNTTTAGGHALFDSAIGTCGIAWTPAGIVKIQLPEASADATRERLLRNLESVPEAAPPPTVRRAIAHLVRHLAGEPQDLADVALDLSALPDFQRRVYESARAVGTGGTTTYGELAERLARPGAARAVGRALGVNPFPIVVPCHRILAANGKMGGFSAYGGVGVKQRLLEIEGLELARREVVRPVAVQADVGFDGRNAVKHLRRVDPTLRRLIDRVGPLCFEIKTTDSTFAALAEAIVYQQLHGKAAATIFGRFKALYPGKRFPAPAAVLATPDPKLREAGLSGSKSAAIKDLASKVESGVVPPVAKLRRMTNEEIIERLTAVRGIGRWTVEMLLMFRLGRPDVLPVDDFGVRKGYSVAFGSKEMPKPADLARYGERWRPYRTVASWYLWRAADLP